MNATDHKRFLMFPFSHGGDHVARLLCLGDTLRAAGHLVEFACGEPASKAAQAAGFRVHSVNEVAADAWRKAIAEGSLQLHDEATANAHVRQESELMRSFRPDAVVGDGRLTLPCSAHIARIRYAQVTRVDRSGVRPDLPPLPPSKHKVVAGIDLTERMPKAMRQSMVRGVLRSWAEPYNKLRKRFGMPLAAGIFDVGTGPLNLLADIPELAPMGDLPESYRWAGPLLAPLPSDVPLPQEILDAVADVTTERSVVVVSLERAGSADLLIDAVKRFTNSARRVVLVTGGLITREQLPGLPTNFTLVPELPEGDRIWKIAQALVFDGFSPFIYRALQYSVPMVGVPQTQDGLDNLKRLTNIGVGVLLTDGLSRVVAGTEQIIARAHISDALGRIGAAMEEYSTARTAAMLVEFATTGKPPAEAAAQ